MTESSPMSFELKLMVENLVVAVRELRDEVRQSNRRIEVLEERSDRQDARISSLEKAVANLQVSTNDRERHSRSWNFVWRTDIKEAPGEDVEDIVRKKLFASVDAVQEMNPEIDVAHRIGRRIPGQPRQIIVRLVRKRDVWTVLDHHRDFRAAGMGPVFQDSTRLDREERKKHLETMKQLSLQGKKTRFRNGRWTVDGVLHVSPDSN